MKKSIATLALFIMIASQGGFPENLKYYFITISSILIFVLVLIPRKEISAIQKKKENPVFSENIPESKEKEESKISHA